LDLSHFWNNIIHNTVYTSTIPIYTDNTIYISQFSPFLNTKSGSKAFVSG